MIIVDKRKARIAPRSIPSLIILNFVAMVGVTFFKSEAEMQKKFSPSQLERDFYVLFGPQSRITAPFEDGALLTSVMSLLFSSIVLILFGSKGIPLLAIVAIVLAVMSVYDALHRKKLWKEYGPIVADTTAYHLLEEAITGSRRGVVAGMKDRKESEKYLLRLWKAAFAEEGRLRELSLQHTAHEDLMDDRLVGDQIKAYFEERQEAVQELNS